AGASTSRFPSWSLGTRRTSKIGLYCYNWVQAFIKAIIAYSAEFDPLFLDCLFAEKSKNLHLIC
ncbi:MAG: hypothetical protein WCS87_16630, partial [Methylococcaceae bacterium]